jgi:hypothetical protein
MSQLKREFKMAAKKQVLNKIARNLEIQGESVSRGANDSVIVENGSSDITIAYVDASFSPTMMGGVDGTVSPFLGIGIGNPGKLTIKVDGADALADVLATAKAVKAFAICAGFANSIQLLRADTSAVVLEVRGHSDLLGMGE